MLSGYQPAWLAADIVAGITLAAVAIPEGMGYTKITATPLVTGLYTLTVLAGFLSGVGITLLVSQLPDMLGITTSGPGVVATAIGVVRVLPQANAPTVLVTLAVLAVVLVCDVSLKKVPGSLLAVVAAIAATWVFGLDQHGVAVVGSIAPGLPTIRLPRPPLEEGGSWCRPRR